MTKQRVREFCLTACLSLALAGAGCATTSKSSAPGMPAAAGFEGAAPKPPGKPTPKSIKVREHGALAFEVPPGWRYHPYSTSKYIPAAFRLDAPDKSAAMLVSISWDGIGTEKEAPNEMQLERALKNRAEKRIRTSVEKAVQLKTVVLADGYAQYAQFTEAMWQNSEITEGSYRYNTDGAFRCGNLWGTFTIYSQDKSGESFRPALAVVQSLHKLQR